MERGDRPGVPRVLQGSPGFPVVLARKRDAATGITENLFCNSIQEVSP